MLNSLKRWLNKNKPKELYDAETQYERGLSYWDGPNGERDYTQAMQWFRMAAEQGHALAQNMLGLCYAEDKGDYNQATMWYRKAAKQGLHVAQHNLAYNYLHGRGVEQDYQQAVYWFRKAAEQGLDDAQFSLAVRYLYGEGVEKDIQQAIYWTRKAAEQGNAGAQYTLALCYNNGEGVEKDFQQVFYWLCKSAEQGIGERELGDCYQYGFGTKPNYQEAEKWYRKAVAHGNEKAQEALRELKLKLKDQKQSQSERKQQPKAQSQPERKQQPKAQNQPECKQQPKAQNQPAKPKSDDETHSMFEEIATILLDAHSQIKAHAQKQQKPKHGILLKLEQPIMAQISMGLPRTYHEILISGNTAIFDDGLDAIKVNLTNAEITTITHKPTDYDTYNIKYDSLPHVLATTIGTAISIWKGLMPYNINDMCNSLTAQMAPHFQPYGLQTELTPNYWCFSSNGSPVTLTDVFRKISGNADFSPAQTSGTLNLNNANWQVRHIAMNQALGQETYSVVPEGTAFFSSTSYTCPSCGKFIAKALVNQSSINVNGSQQTIDKVFTCKYCKEFFAPLIGKPLNSGSIYHLQVDDENYQAIVKQIDSCGRHPQF